MTDWLRKNWSWVSGIIAVLFIIGGWAAHTEEQVQKIPDLEKAVIGIEKILEAQQSREEGKTEGQRKVIEKCKRSGKLSDKECEELGE